MACFQSRRLAGFFLALSGAVFTICSCPHLASAQSDIAKALADNSVCWTLSSEYTGLGSNPEVISAAQMRTLVKSSKTAPQLGRSTISIPGQGGVATWKRVPCDLAYRVGGSGSVWDVPPGANYTWRNIDITIAAGVSNFSGTGTIGSHDVITTDRDKRDQSYSGTGGVIGLWGTFYSPNVPVFNTHIMPFFRTGFLYDFKSSRTSPFDALGDNVAHGTTKVSQSWSVPVLVGFDTPFPFFGMAHLQVFGGGMADRRTIKGSISEIGTSEITTTSKSQTQLNPAVGGGISQQFNDIKIGGSVIVDFQRSFSHTVQSGPYPSAFYTQDTGHQVNTTALFTVSRVFTIQRNFTP